jgi:hypothetical protein
MAFEKFRNTLPSYYNDYLNSYLKYLGIQPASNLQTTPSERALLESNRQLS